MSGVRTLELRSSRLRVTLLELGAAIHRVQVPGHGADGAWVDVHLFLPTAEEYLDRAANPHLGASVGRYANRIAGARFPLDGRIVELVANAGANHLHGGSDGFDRRTWDVVAATDAVATFVLHSPVGDQGYPGAMRATATYEVDGPTLQITYTATADAPTVVNLTNHGYWNLAGVGPADPAIDGPGSDPSAADHSLVVHGDRYLPVNGSGVPTGGLAPVTGTPFDLRAPRRVGAVIDSLDGGLDHCFAVRGAPGERLSPAARLADPSSGRTLNVSTDQPGIQAYTGNNLRPPFRVHGAVSLETQRFPDTPNRPDLGSARLDPGEEYRSLTRLTFG